MNSALNNLKRRVLSKGSKEDSIIYYRSLQAAGGYSELMNMPYPSFKEMLKGIYEFDKMEAKKNKYGKGFA